MSVYSRQNLLSILRGDRCVRMASVFDPLSARMAADLGYEACMLAGSVASLTVLGAPDIALLTLTELVEQTRRICRAGGPPLVVDADHGFGNALNAARTVQELEAAGAAGLTLEDALLPRAFDGAPVDLVSVEEAVRKLRAALDARSDPDLAIISRTFAYMTHGLPAALERVRRLEAEGPDAVFVVGLTNRAELEAVREAAGGLPLMAYAVGPEVTGRSGLEALGVRLLIEGHAPVNAAMTAAWNSLALQRFDGDTLPPPPPNLVAALSRAQDYERDTARYLTSAKADHEE